MHFPGLHCVGTQAFSNEREQLYATADGEDLSGSKAILSQCRKKLDEERGALERKLKVTPEFVQDHPYFKLGVIDALKWVLSLPGEARQLINNMERG